MMPWPQSGPWSFKSQHFWRFYAIFCLFFIAWMGAFAPGVAQAQVDDGFMVIPRDAWRTSDTGRVEACTAVKEEIGVLSNTYTCTRWGSLQELSIRFTRFHQESIPD